MAIVAMSGQVFPASPVYSKVQGTKLTWPRSDAFRFSVEVPASTGRQGARAGPMLGIQSDKEGVASCRFHPKAI